MTGLIAWRSIVRSMSANCRRLPTDDADNMQQVHDDQRKIEFERRAAHYPDHGDGTAHAGRADRLLDRACAADLDHEIDAATAGQLARGLAPFRVFPIIDRMGGAER